MGLTAFVTGCAGFIGSHLTDRLLSIGWTVVGFDNFSTGQRQFLEGALARGSFRLVQGTLLDSATVREAMAGSDVVFHLSGNADVRGGPQHPYLDLEQNTIVTHNVLEAMRLNGVRKIAFSSSGSVYGEPSVFPTPEDAPFPVQTSLYGASKLAGEGLISAYCEAFAFQAWIFRFTSIVGERYTHGHVIDFYRQLRRDPTHLRVLGNGRQRKSYLYVHDCVDAMLIALERATAPINILNLGSEDFCDVDDSVRWISETLQVRPALEHTGGDRGWVGDSPFIFLDTRRIRTLGWSARLSIREGIQRTIAFLCGNEWVLEARP
ncbi:MAG TPA: NAD-dependent epimerase/dehydratase family protein [Steroidobacteraceae bacterium]|nr:NAD-dependent epimerase/dehydratase family protein [Steroidobacteraceae bacterium]